jgi:hypothetical protein
MSNRDFFDKEIRRRFEGFEPEPPAEAWLAIERGLVASSPARLFAPWLYRVAAAIAVLAVTGFSFLYFWVGEQQHHRQLAEREIQINHSLTADPDVQAPAAISLPAEVPVLAAIRGLPLTAGHVPAWDEEVQIPASGASDGVWPISGPRAIGMKPGSVAGIAPVLAAYTHPLIHGSIRGMGEKWPHSDMLAFTPAGTGSQPAFSLGAFIAPQYNNRRIANGSGMASTGVPFSSLEEETLTYSFGLTGSIRLSNRLVLQTGATYLNVAQVVNQINALAHPDRRQFYNPYELPAYGHPQIIFTSLGTINFDDPTLYFEDLGSNRVETTKWPLDIPEPKLLEALGFGLTQRFSFVEIPVVFRYTLFERQIGLHMKAGLAANFLVGNEVLLVSDTYKGVVGQTSGLRDQYLSGIGGFVMTVPVSPRIQLFIEPTGQIFLNPMVRDDKAVNAAKAFPYNFSVYSGLSYRF